MLTHLSYSISYPILCSILTLPTWANGGRLSYDRQLVPPSGPVVRKGKEHFDEFGYPTELGPMTERCYFNWYQEPRRWAIGAGGLFIRTNPARLTDVDEEDLNGPDGFGRCLFGIGAESLDEKEQPDALLNGFRPAKGNYGFKYVPNKGFNPDKQHVWDGFGVGSRFLRFGPIGGHDQFVAGFGSMVEIVGRDAESWLQNPVGCSIASQETLARKNNPAQLRKGEHFFGSGCILRNPAHGFVGFAGNMENILCGGYKENGHLGEHIGQLGKWVGGASTWTQFGHMVGVRWLCVPNVELFKNMGEKY